MAIGIAQAAANLGAAVTRGAVVCRGSREQIVGRPSLEPSVTAARRRVEAVTDSQTLEG
jgi:hypothetical protein